jgi:internalin A
VQLPGRQHSWANLYCRTWTRDGDGLRQLRGLTRLTGLRLADTAITDAGLAHLRPWAGVLEHLDLSQTGITDAGLAHLRGFGKLQSLALAGSKVTDAGLVHLRGLTGLKSLNLKGTAVSPAGVEGLRKALPEVQVES